MAKIRVNELARELEIKTAVVIEYLAELGVSGARSHSSALDDGLANKVREHFRTSSQRPVMEPNRTPVGYASLRPLTRSIAQIKAEARRTVEAGSPTPLPVKATTIPPGPIKLASDKSTKNADAPRRELRHYIKILEHLKPYALAAGAPQANWQAAIFDDVSNGGRFLICEPLSVNERGGRIALHGDTFYCEVSADWDREDSLFVFRVSRARLPRVPPGRYSAQFQLLSSKFAPTDLDPIGDLWKAVPSQVEGPLQPLVSSSLQGDLSQELIGILGRSPEDLLSAWAPQSVPQLPVAASDFVRAFRRPWVRFRLERYARLTPRQESIVNETLKPEQIGSKERTALLDVLDFNMINSIGRENAARPEAVPALIFGLLKELAILPLRPEVRARVWQAMLAGLGKSPLLRKLKESSSSLSSMCQHSPVEAQIWGKALLSLIRSLGERESDPIWSELYQESVQRATPLSYIVEWLEKHELRPEASEITAESALQSTQAVTELSEIASKEPQQLPVSPSPDSHSPDEAEGLDARSALDAWVLGRQVPDVDALEATIHEVTGRLSRLGEHLPTGTLANRAVELAKVLCNLTAEIQKWQEFLPNPETLASDYQLASEVYHQARQILGNEVDRIISSAKLTPGDLGEALRLIQSRERLKALPQWVWNQGTSPSVAEDGEVPTGAWIKQLIVPEVRERVSAVLHAFEEFGEENLPLLPFVPSPETSGEQEIEQIEVIKHVRTWLQDFSGLLSPLPPDLRTQFQSQLASPTDYKRIIYCAGIFRDLKERFALTTCVELVNHLYAIGNLDEMYDRGDAFLKAIKQLETLMGDASSDATFKQLMALADKPRPRQAPEEQEPSVPPVTIEHNWVDRRNKAPLCYFSDVSLPYGSVTVPLSLRTRHKKFWALGLAVNIRSGHRDYWASDWPPIRPQELDIKDSDWRADVDSPEISVYSFNLVIPLRRDRGRGVGFKFDITLVDRQTGKRLGLPQPFEWEVMNDAPPSIISTWPQSTDPRYVEDHPIGPQQDSQKLLAHLRNFGSFYVTAPRRFGKSTLIEYLGKRAREQEFVVSGVWNCSNMEYLKSSGLDYERFWNDISNDLQEQVGAAINRPLREGLPDENAFDYVRCNAKSKGKKGIVILIDEAQTFFPKRIGTALGDTLKDRLERHWSRQDDPDFVPLVMGLVGLPSLGERAGANLLALLLSSTKDHLEDDELNRLILSGTGGHLQTTREARRQLAKSARNLFILKALTDKLAKNVFTEHHAWANFDDSLKVERELKDELQKGQAEPLAAYVADALNDAERVSPWVPNPALALAIALASAREKGVSLGKVHEEAKAQLRSWCESLRDNTAIQRLTYDDEQFDEHLRILRERRVFENGEFSSELLEWWLIGLRRQSQSDLDTWHKTVLKAAIRRLRPPVLLGKVEDSEGGQASVRTCSLEGIKYAVRITPLRTVADRQRFAEEKEVLDELRKLTLKGMPGNEYVFSLAEVGLSADNEWEAIQIYRWIEGFDLSRRVGQLDGPFVADLGRKLSRALLFLHSAGILHRDLRPKNVVLSEQSFDPIIIDFGFARRLTSGGKTSLNDDWAAPEVRCENPTWTKASDIYALGATLRAVVAPCKEDNSLNMLLEKCCHISPNERPNTGDLEALFKDVAGELHVDAKREQIWKHLSDLSSDDRAKFVWFGGIMNKFQPKFEALSLGCASSQFDRAREVADFLNQVLEASGYRQLSLGKAKAVPVETNGALVS